jgi:hypothetical protein
MDPYLEAPMRWPGVHSAIIATLREMLSRQVRPRFFVDSEDEIIVLAPDDPARSLVRPDLSLSEAEPATMPRRERGRITAPVVLELPEPITVRIPFLVVRDTADQRVVATIELLSPVNKVPNSRGRRAFLRKRERLLRSDAHWIEIDLLRAGERPPEVAGRADYYAALHRAEAGGKVEAWFADLREALPTIAVPLVPPLPDVPLDLQAAIETMYERYGYEAIIDYAADPPSPPLDPDDAAWAAERIRRWRAERESADGR